MLALFVALQVLDEGVEEAFESWQDAAEDGRIDLGVGQQFIAASGKTAVHRWLLSDDFCLRKFFVGNNLAPIKKRPTVELGNLGIWNIYFWNNA